MSGSSCNRLVVVAVLLATLMVGASQANAWWGWRCCRPCCTPCWSYGCYAPCYTACYVPRCYSSCWYPCGGWSYSSWDVTCYDTLEVSEPAAEPAAPAPPQVAPTLAPKGQMELPKPETEPTLFPPEPEPSAPAEATPTEPAPSPADVETPGVVLPPSPGTVPPPGSSIPDMPDIPAVPDRLDTPAPPTPEPGDAAPAPAKPTASVPAPEQSSGVIGAWVPEEARVLINGLETKSTGRYREYVSYGLKPGCIYRYEVRAQIVRDGRLIENTRTVYLKAGAQRHVTFRFEAKPEEAIAAL